mmetsp:Transcript_89626/g.256052  ORF Transcript_89626/g.256052 Transcript_89626/m.256052 type:complete len:436 (-) Transcript_89626:18-1325(-)
MSESLKLSTTFSTRNMLACVALAPPRCISSPSASGTQLIASSTWPIDPSLPSFVRPIVRSLGGTTTCLCRVPVAIMALVAVLNRWDLPVGRRSSSMVFAASGSSAVSSCFSSSAGGGSTGSTGSTGSIWSSSFWSSALVSAWVGPPHEGTIALSSSSLVSASATVGPPQEGTRAPSSSFFSSSLASVPPAASASAATASPKAFASAFPVSSSPLAPPSAPAAAKATSCTPAFTAITALPAPRRSVLAFLAAPNWVSWIRMVPCTSFFCFALRPSFSTRSRINSPPPDSSGGARSVSASITTHPKKSPLTNGPSESKTLTIRSPAGLGASGIRSGKLSSVQTGSRQSLITFVLCTTRPFHSTSTNGSLAPLPLRLKSALASPDALRMSTCTLIIGPRSSLPSKPLSTSEASICDRPISVSGAGAFSFQTSMIILCF